MFTRTMLKAAALFAPQWADVRSKRDWYVRQVKQQRARLVALPSLEAKVDDVIARTDLGATQKRSEIGEVLRRVAELRPASILEIGAFEGGTLALFAQAAGPGTFILSLDISYQDHQLAAYPHFANLGQQITCRRCDSHAASTPAIVRDWLGGRLLDVLFIDGDHSYDGVKADYEMYAPFVRPGGLIAFHDIHPDYRTRYGRITEADVGEVPRFWRELKAGHTDVTELIEDPEQDGMGIGVLTKPAHPQGSP